MKNIQFLIILTVLLFNSLNIKAQETIKPIETRLGSRFTDNPNTYFKDTSNRLQDLVGSWEYSNNGIYFKITFYKLKVIKSEKYNVFGDVLFSNFIYSVNGEVIYDNYDNVVYPISANVNTKPSKIESAFVLPTRTTFLYTEPSMNDCHRRLEGRLEITYLNNATPQIQWVRTTETRHFRSNPCDNGVLPDDSDFVIPANMVLTKIE